MMGVQGHGQVQLTEGWTAYQPGQMMVSMMPQGFLGPPPPAALPVNPTYVTYQFPAVPNPAAFLPQLPAQQSFCNPLANSTQLFASLFRSTLPCYWTLMPYVETDPVDNFHVFHDSAKVRFQCKTCGKAWTSMKGRVIFWFQAFPQHNYGVVYFKLYGQKCEKCNKKEFEDPLWYPEEVHKVVSNVYSAVRKAFYGFAEAPVSRERRKGKPRTQHNSSLCQACADKVCKEGICQ